MLVRAAQLACAVASAAAVAGAQRATAADGDVRIADFRPATGTLVAGATAASELVVENRGARARRVWIGYSVGGPNGEWFDVPAEPADLAPNTRSPRRMSWVVPTPAPSGGEYRVVMAVWSAPPGSAGAERLASADRRESFRLDAVATRIGPEGAWHAGDHNLGRGRVRPSLVSWSTDGFRLKLAGDACDGAEIRSVERQRFAELTARMRTPKAPGSLSALFLYGDTPGGNDEIDLEIHDDSTRRAILTAWIAGKETRSADVTLPFDPSAAMHDYTIRWTNRELTFLADGRRIGGWTSGFPTSPMRAMANVWRPTWLACDVPAPGAELAIESIRFDPLRR